MELCDLVGVHVLDAVDFSEEDFEDASRSVCRFRLDGVVYTVSEDPEDGYRSHDGGLVAEPQSSVSNVFTPINVVGRYRESILTLIDAGTGEDVLVIGTDYMDEWYPFYVAYFNPAAMLTNRGPR